MMRPRTCNSVSGPPSCSYVFAARALRPALHCNPPAARRHVSAAACATIESRPTVSPHTDAQRRRMEFEAMCAKREAERKSAKDRETAGLKWWQGSLPSNMMAIERRPELLQLLVEGATTSRLQILNFFNEDCYACRTLYPQIKKLANQHPDVIFVEVNGTPEEMRPLLEEMGITRVPYFHFYKNGRVVSQFTASLNPEKLAMLRLEITSHRQ